MKIHVNDNTDNLKSMDSTTPLYFISNIDLDLFLTLFACAFS